MRSLGVAVGGDENVSARCSDTCVAGRSSALGNPGASGPVSHRPLRARRERPVFPSGPPGLRAWLEEAGRGRNVSVPLGGQVGRLIQGAVPGVRVAPQTRLLLKSPPCVPGPLCGPGQTVSERHQEEEAGGLCRAHTRRPESQLLSDSAGRLWSSGRQGQLP